MLKVSILVAVYNAEKFIGRCLESLIRQTYSNIEIICVDDGSSDKSVEIIEEYIAKDNRIKLIKHDKNQGAANARNTAFYASTGDVIGYLDSDDLYADDTIEKLVSVFEAHEDAGCVLYRCIKEDENGNQHDYDGLEFDSLSGREAFIESLNWHIHGVYAARADLWRTFPMDTTRKHFSDDNTTRLHYLNSERVYQSDAHYYYKYNPNSISNQIDVSRMDYMAATQSMRNQLEALNCEKQILEIYEEVRWRVVVDCYLFYFKHRGKFDENQREYCLSELKTGWESVDESLLPQHLSRKFGFHKHKDHWKLFRAEEELYFSLRKLLGRL